MQSASKSNNYYYNKNLQSYAEELRKNMTKAESCLWKYVLKAGKLKGYKFNWRDDEFPDMNFDSKKHLLSY